MRLPLTGLPGLMGLLLGSSIQATTDQLGSALENHADLRGQFKELD